MNSIELFKQDGKPAGVWYFESCRKNHFAVADSSDMLERIADNGYEDFEIDSLEGIPELNAAVAKFNEANAHICAYEPDFKRAIMLEAAQ